MAIPLPRPTLVIRYSYLWSDEAKAGAEEGRKDRPAAVILVKVDVQGRQTVLVAPITHVEPAAGEGVEIPKATKQRLGLDDDRSWIITTEVNQFEWPGPDLRATGKSDPEDFSYGYLPAKIFDAVRDQIQANSKVVSSRIVKRTS
jgi:hypothetical protein